jgi:hypothetical protein
MISGRIWKKNNMIGKYYGISYPEVLCEPLKLENWKEEFCSENFHLFDEVYSIEDHYLICDACGLTVNISSIMENEIEVSL